MVSEVKFTFQRVQILLQNFQHCRWSTDVVSLFCAKFQRNSMLKVWEDAVRQWPCGVKCENFHAISINTKHSPNTSYSANLSSDIAKFSAASFMKCQGDIAGNYEFLKQQWHYHKIVTGLDKWDESVHLATLRSAIGRECLQILLNLSFSDEVKKRINKCLEVLETTSSWPEILHTSGMFFRVV